MNVIRKNLRLLRKTVDVNKSLVIIGNKEKDIQNQFNNDKVELNSILKITKKIFQEEISCKGIEGFHRLGKFEAGRSRPLKVTFQNISIMEDILKNADELH